MDEKNNTSLERGAPRSTNHDAEPAAIAPVDRLVRLGATDRESVGTDKAEPLNRDCGTGNTNARLAALEELSALDQEIELKHGITGNPMIKAQTNTESELERLRGQLAWTERERDSLRVAINNLRDYVAELNAELFAAETEPTQPRNGALSGVPDPDSRVWETQRTPHPHATPPQGSVQGEGSVRDSRNAKEPVAWRQFLLKARRS